MSSFQSGMGGKERQRHLLGLLGVKIVLQSVLPLSLVGYMRQSELYSLGNESKTTWACLGNDIFYCTRKPSADCTVSAGNI